MNYGLRRGRQQLAASAHDQPSPSEVREPNQFVREQRIASAELNDSTKLGSANYRPFDECRENGSH
jgi:hypothetical protein